MIAASEGHGEIITALLEAHANAEMLNYVCVAACVRVRVCSVRSGGRFGGECARVQIGGNALAAAALFGHDAAVRVLVNAGARTDLIISVRSASRGDSDACVC